MEAKAPSKQATSNQVLPTTIITTTTTKTTPTSRYVRDFESLFIPINRELLRDKARGGDLRHCQFRSLLWRYFLRCLPEQYNQWLESCAKSREHYETIKAKHASAKQPDQQLSSTNSARSSSLSSSMGKTRNASEAKLDDNMVVPEERQLNDDKNREASKQIASAIARNKELEDERQYIKAANQCDYSNVFRTIERDVVRTFPDMEFFRQTEIQSILENILFNFASENLHLSYKQGMHELLATLLYVSHTDSQNCLINYQGGYANETIAALLDLRYLEHDVFHLFCALMKSIETWYQNDEILMMPDTPSSLRENGGIINRSGRQQVGSVLGIKLKMISENIVRNFDLELFNHLEALQIPPQIYGIRWMRLLFGREFEFLDLLTVWDSIICDQIPMSLTEYIFASMLVTIREELVNGDYTDCLTNLMRHQFKDVQLIIKLALHLRDPKSHPRPKLVQLSSQKFYSSQKSQNHLQQHQNNRFPSRTSLTSKLSQQYISRNKNQQEIRASKPNQHPFSASQLLAVKPVKEYEMREMQSSSSSSSSSNPARNNPTGSRFQLGNISGSKNALNLSTESYDDLHSIVDYCWRLLSEQIDSLQKCLPREKSLSSEDEIFVALAQLKKVRDVLKGSLRLEDELESPPGGSRS